MRAGVTLLLVGIVGAGAGCSALFVQSPSVVPGSNGEEIECTDSRLWPWVDTYLATGYTVGSVALAAKSCSHEDFDCIEKVGLLALVPAAIGYGISAIWGHSAVSECKNLAAKAAARSPAPTATPAMPPPVVTPASPTAPPPS